MKTKRRKPQGFNASALQVRRAWEAHNGRRMSEAEAKLTYSELGNQLVVAMGLEAAQAYIMAQSNDPNAVEGLDS